MTGIDRSGLFSRKTVAVITFVMLAIERWLWEFSSQRTWFGFRVVDDGRGGAKVGHELAAPSSTLYRGSAVSAISRTMAAARACASLLFRVSDRWAE